MTFLPLLGVGALLLAPTAAPIAAYAQQATAASVTVGHADLDLSTRRGVAALDRRIERAARTACGYASPSDLAGKIRLRDCREQARASVTARRDQLAAAARPVEVAAGR